jgi:hypothetical protein
MGWSAHAGGRGDAVGRGGSHCAGAHSLATHLLKGDQMEELVFLIGFILGVLVTYLTSVAVHRVFKN